jgi:hypothetical protein
MVNSLYISKELLEKSLHVYKPLYLTSVNIDEHLIYFIQSNNSFNTIKSLLEIIIIINFIYRFIKN